MEHQSQSLQVSQASVESSIIGPIRLRQGLLAVFKVLLDLEPDDMPLGIDRQLCQDVYDRLARTDPSPIDLLAPYGEWTGGYPGKGCFVWHGKFNKRGTPIMRSWRDVHGDHNDVAVYRILWSELRGDPLIGNPKKLPVCTDVRCASPLCYVRCVPMAVTGDPITQHSMRTRDYTSLDARRPKYRGEYEERDGKLMVPCPECRADTHISFETRMAYVGKFIYCNECEQRAKLRHAASGRAGPRRDPHKGLVLYKGSWISQDVYDAIVKPGDADADDALYAMFDAPAE